MNTYGGAHEVSARRVGRNLQTVPIPGDGVVGGDPALLLNAQQIAPLRLADRHESRAALRRCDGETGVMGRQIDITDIAVGRLEIGVDPGQRQLLWQPVLKRPEGPLAAPASLWCI